MPAAGDVFGLGPMDNNSFCKDDACTECGKLLSTSLSRAEANNKFFSNGKASDFWFTFCNRIAKEVGKSHPDKFISSLAYMNWAKHPDFDLEPNIAIWLCMGNNCFWDLPVERQEMAIYRDWIAREKGRRIYMYLYSEFPEAVGMWLGYTSFPGLNARAIAEQLKMFHRDGIRGLMGEGLTTQLNEIIYNQLAFDVEQDPQRIIDEFFTLYYGAAAEQMGKLWNEIEDTYRNPANYPPEIQTKDEGTALTEEISWKWLGTQDRMDRWAGNLAQAKMAAKTDTEQARVTLFEQGLWQIMVTARQTWVNKQEHAGDVESLKKAAPPTSHAPAIPDAGGDLAKVDWSKAGRITVERTHEGYPSDRKIAVDILHGADHLYLRLADPIGKDKVVSDGSIFNDDRWEIFMGAQCDKPEYVQFGVKPDGRFVCNANPGCSEIQTQAKVRCRLDDQGWVTELALPLSLVRSFPGASPDAVYLNLYRAASGGQTTLAWSPNFLGNGYNSSARLGQVMLDK
ncbi:MAG: DUF4838 domain-containing protein [Phycisphaeraceae bacterium]|nr:DUF4838 domain-containing protein [Phycisphaeraceae bacterium]